MEQNPAGYIELQNFPTGQLNNFLTQVLREFDKRVDTFNLNLDITSLLLTPDNKYLLVGTADGLIQVYQTQTMENFPFQGHKGKVSCLCNVGIDKIASAGEDKSIILWNLDAKEKIAQLFGPGAAIKAQAASIQRNLIVTGGLESTIYVYDLENLILKKELIHHKGHIRDICFAKDDNVFITAGTDMKIVIWNSEELNMHMEIIQEAKINYMIYCPFTEKSNMGDIIDKGVLVTGGEDKIVRLWNIVSGEKTLLPKHKSQITAMCHIENSPYLITGSAKGKLYLFNTQLARYETEFKLPSPPKVTVCSPDGKYLYIGESDKTIRRLRLVEELQRKDKIVIHEEINAAIISSDGKSIFTIGEDLIVKRTDVETGVSENLRKFEGSPKCLSINSTGALMAVGFQFSNVKLWDLKIRKEIQSLSEHTLPVVSVDFSKDGQKFASASSDYEKGEVAIYDLNTYNPIKTLSVAQPVKSICFSPDSTTVIYATENELHVLAVSNQESERALLKGFAQQIYTLKPNYSTNHIVSVGGNGMIDIWNLNFNTLITSFNCVQDEEEDLKADEDKDEENEERRHKVMHERQERQVSWIGGGGGRRQAPKISKLLSCSISEDGEYLLVGTQREEIQFWSTTDKILIGTIKVNLRPKQILLDNINGKIYVVSTNEIISMRNPVKAKSNNLFIFGPSIYSMLFTSYFRLFMENEYYGDYPSHLNEWVILPWRINILHLFAYTVNLKYANLAFKGRCKFLSTTSGVTPLTLALDSKNKELIDLVIKKIAKYTKVDWHIFTRIEVELPRLNELATPNLSTLYNAAFQRSKQPDLVQFGVLKTREGHPFSSNSYHIDCKNFIKSTLSSTENEQFLIYRVSSFKFNMTLGNLEGISFLTTLIACEDQDVYTAPIISTIIKSKWKTIRPLMLIHALFYLLFLFILGYYSLMQTSPGQDTVLFVLIIVLNFILFIYECFQISIGIKQYLQDFWNWLDMARIILIFAYGFIEPFVGGDLSTTTLALILLASFQRGLGFFRVFKQTRYMIRMLTEILHDMIPFVVVLAFSVLAFTLMFQVLSGLSENKTFFEALIHSYLLLFGAFDYGNYTGAEWSCFYVATIVNPLMMFNLLVAIMGETYGRVQEEMVVADIQSMVAMIIEYEAILFWRRHSGTPMHLQLCTSSEDDSDSKSTTTLEKQGQILLKDILSLQNRLDKVIKDNQGNYDGMNRRIIDILKQGGTHLQKVEDKHSEFRKQIYEKINMIKSKKFPEIL